MKDTVHVRGWVSGPLQQVGFVQQPAQHAARLRWVLVHALEQSTIEVPLLLSSPDGEQGAADQSQ